MSKLEEHFHLQLQARGIHGYVREHRFGEHKGPKGRTAWYRMDFAWPEQKVAVEIDGGSWVGGRHSRGSGFERDCRKACHAALEGWRVLRGTGSMVKSCELVEMLEKALNEGS